MGVLRYFITSKAKRNLLKFFFGSDGAYYTREVARLTGEPLNAVRRELGYMEKAGLLASYMQGNQKYYQVVKEFPLLAEWKKIILETDDTGTPSRRKPAAALVKEQQDLSAVEGETVTTPEPPDISPIIPGAQVIMNHLPAEAPKKAETPPAEAERIATTRESRAQETASTVASLTEYLKEQFDDVATIALAVIHGDAAKSEYIPADGIDLLIVGDIDKDALLEMIGNVEESTGIGINLTRMTRSDFDYRNAKGDPLVRRIWGEKKLVVKGRHQG